MFLGLLSLFAVNSGIQIHNENKHPREIVKKLNESNFGLYKDGKKYYYDGRVEDVVVTKK